MPTVTVNTFTLNYALYTNAEPGHDVQFGMDFTVTSRGGKPLSQLIFPATAVGNNRAGVWNVDNHAQGGTINAIVYPNAQNGTITDGPREIIRPSAARGVMRTKFAVFIVDTTRGAVQTSGIAFSYSIDPTALNPSTAFDGAQAQTMTSEQKQVLLASFPALAFQ
jgi:hypothetical protein